MSTGLSYLAGVTGEMDILVQLRNNLENNTEKLGFKREFRAFSPHLTLDASADSARPNDIQKIGELINKTTFTALHNISVNQINLMKSVLTPTGAIIPASVQPN